MSMLMKGAAITCVIVTLLMPFSRTSSDEEYFARYSKGQNSGSHGIRRRPADDINAFGVEQRPIYDPPPTGSRIAGQHCFFSRDCATECCVIHSKYRFQTCQRKAQKGEYCSKWQIKGGNYNRYCPCEAGYVHCKRGVCEA